MTNDEPEHTTADRPLNDRLDTRHYGDQLEDDDRPVPAHVEPPTDEPGCPFPLTFRRASELRARGATHDEVREAIENAEADR